MKNKKLLIGLIAGVVLVAAVVAGIFLLSGGNGDDPNAGTEATAQVTISQTSAEIGVGGKLYLTAEAKNTQEPIVWASSDSSVATVKNGEVTGLKEGTTIISASAGAAVAECAVTVSMDAPVLVLNQEYVAVSIGGSYTVKAEIHKGGQAYGEAVTFQWVADEGSDKVAKVEVSGDGSSAVVTGVAYGDTQYHVTANVNGVQLIKKVTIVCCNTDITFNATGEGVAPAMGGFDANVELGKSLQPLVTVMNKEQVVENAQLVWSSEDETIATVTEDGIITGLTEGQTVVICKYGDENNYVKFYVNVYRPIYNMDTHYNVETAVGSLTISDKLEGTIKGATLDGISIFARANGKNIVFKSDAMPSDPEVMGEGRELVVHTDRAQYVYKVSVYSKVIWNAEQFQNMAKYMKRSQGDNNWAQYTGYIVLGTDIDLKGASFEMFIAEPWSGTGGLDMDVNMGFNGILDGRGYSVKNYTATAGNNTMFTAVGKNGIIRNISFLDITAPATTGNILTRLLNGTVKDTYISIKTWESGSVLAHSYRSGRKLEQVVIEYTGPAIEGVRDITGCWGTPPTYFVHYPLNIQDVYVVGNVTTIETNCKEHGSDNPCGFHVYKNLAQMKSAGNDYSKFNPDVWNLSSGIPVPGDVYAQRAKQDITIANTEKIVSAGDVITLLANVDHVTWRITKTPTGVSLKGNVLTIGDKANLGEVTVVATNVFNSSKKATYTFEVVEMSHQKLASLGDLELNDTKGQTSIALDLSKATAFTEVVGIKINGKEIPVASLNGTQVTIATEHLKQFLGKNVEIVLTCKLADGYNKVTVPAFVVSKVLETAEDVQSMADFMDRTEGDNNWTQYTGYLVLGNDIDLQGAAFDLFVAEPWSGDKGGDDNKANMGFNGTLNGRGHALKNYTATAGHNTLFTVVGKAGLIQNISFTDITAPGAAGNILTRLLNGKLQDVYISLKTWDNGALIAHSYRDGRFMENVVIEYTGAAIDGLRDVTGHWGEANYFVHYPDYIKNVYIVGNIKTVVTNCEEHNADGKDNCGFHVYKTLADMKAADNDYSGFSKDIWNTAIGIPVPKDIYAERSAMNITILNTQTNATFGDVLSLEANVPYVSWSIKTAPKGVTLSGNRLTIAANAGKGTVTVTATNLFNSGKTATYSFLVTTMTEQSLPAIGDLELNKEVGQTTVTLDLSGADAYTAVEGIKIGETEIPVLSQSGTTVTVETKHLKPFLGKNVEIVLTCKSAEGYNKVTVPAFVLSKIVTTEEELDHLADYMDDINGDGTEYQGFIALGNDITCTEQLERQFYHAEIAGTNVGFNGTFDGRGFAIHNMKPDNQGFISTLGEKGIIRNVSFLNVDTVGTNKYNLAFTRYSYGKMQDVYISMDDWTEASLFLNGNGNWINLERVVIVANNPSSGKVVFADALNERDTLQNVHFVGAMSVDFRVDDVKGGKNVYTQYATLAALKAGITPEQLAAFDNSFWNTDCGLPVPAKLYAAWSATDVEITNDKVGDGYELNKGSSMDLTANVPYVQWELVGNTDSKITLVGNKLTAADGATATAVKVKATNLYNDAMSAEITVLITNSQYKDLTQIEYLELMATAGQTDVYIDLEETNTVTQISGVTVDGNAAPAGTFSFEGGKLKLASEQLQAYCGKPVTLVISYKTADANVTATCNVSMVVTQVIDDAAELKALGAACQSAAQTGYYVLGGNIDCSGEANMAAGNPGWQKNGFRGIFDGCGYTISNIKMTWDTTTQGYGGLFGNLVGATIRNVTFDKVNYASANVTLFGRHNVNIANGNNTTFTDVTINISGWAVTGEGGVFASRGTLNTLYNNVTVNVADGLTIHNLLGQEWNSNHGTGITVNLGIGSKITAFYWTGTSDTTAVTTAPSIVTVNAAYVPVVETVDTFMPGEGTTSFTFTHDKLPAGEVSVSVDGGAPISATAGDGTLTVDLGAIAMGKHTVVITTAKGDELTYTEVWYVTQVIDTVAELKALGAACKAANTTGYYILGANIDCSGEANMAAGNPGWQKNGFSGTFDGRNYTISNITMTYDSATSGYGGLFGNLAGCTIKNVVFDKVYYASVNVSLFGRHSYASGGNNVTLENLTVNISAWGASGEAGIFVSRGTLNTIYNNVTVNVAENVTIHNLLGQEWNSNYGTGITVNLGLGSTITAFYWTGTAANTAVTTAPSIVTVNAAKEPVVEQIDTLVAGENSTTVTFTHEVFAYSTTATVVINETTVENVAINSGAITVNLADYGVSAMGHYTAVITTNVGDELTYTEVWYVTQVIDNVAELKALGAACKAANTTGYYILGANIDCSGEANMAAGNPGWQANGFSGTFDGRNLTVSNLKFTWDNPTGGYGGLFGNLIGGTIKNVTFDKVNYASVNVSLFGRHSIKSNTYNTNSIIENVTINISAWGASGEAGVFVSRGTLNTVYNNVTVNVAENVTVHNLLGQEWSSNYGSGITVNLEQGSAISAFYWTGTAATSAVTTAPSIVKVNAPSAPVEDTINTLFAGENTTTVTLEHEAFASGTATVTINEQTKQIAVSAGKLTVNLSDFGVSAMGQYEAVVEIGADKYTFSEIWYVTQVIDTVAELKALGAACKAANTTGFYILGANIDCSGEANMAVGNPGWEANGFSGTFDGRNLTISNIKLTWDNATSGYGGLFGNLDGCTIRNVVFDKVNYASNNVALLGRHTYKTKGPDNVKLENLTVNVSAWNASAEAGIFVSRSSRNTLFNNLTVNIADGVTVHNLLGQQFSSAYGSGIKVILGTGSKVSAYYWTGTDVSTAVTTVPSFITVSNATKTVTAPAVIQVTTAPVLAKKTPGDFQRTWIM